MPDKKKSNRGHGVRSARGAGRTEHISRMGLHSTADTWVGLGTTQNTFGTKLNELNWQGTAHSTPLCLYYVKYKFGLAYITI